MRYLSSEKYNKAILEYRSQQNFAGAIKECEKAIQEFPHNNFYYKILGDLYFVIDEFENSFNQYIEFLKRIEEKKWLFSKFAASFERIANVQDEDALGEKIKRIITEFENNSFSPDIKKELFDFININLKFAYSKDEQITTNIERIKQGTNLNMVEKFVSQRKNNFFYVKYFLNEALKYDTWKGNNELCKVVISFLEKNQEYSIALELAKQNLFISVKKDPVLIRTLIRICRVIGDYSETKNYLDNNDVQYNFNIYYELVYYYDFLKDFIKRDKLLIEIEKKSEDSVSILKTLYNLNLQFGNLERAKIISDKLNDKLEINHSKKKYAEMIVDSESNFFEVFHEIYKQQEHNKSLVALKDLIKGFSHELGQPITNIRYMIQYWQTEMDTKSISQKDIAEIFKDILLETERIGALLKRFQPLTNSKSIDMKFNLVERIVNNFKSLETRLSGEGIKYTIKFEGNCEIFADPVKIDQIFINLIINSIHALENTNQKFISVNVYSNKGYVTIKFQDNGYGIKEINHMKIFEPFFTTKPPGRGEGLGLFIVFNILKMYDATINVNNNSNGSGTTFTIQIPIKEAIQ